LTDAELLRGVRAGDLSAWEQIYARCLPTVWRYVYLGTGGDRHLAEDVVGESVLALVRQISSLTLHDGNLTGWLIAVARNKLGDHIRRAARAAALVAEARENNTSTAVRDGPEAALEAAETRQRVLAVMDGLPDEERLALEWKYVDGLSVAEIAGRIGRTEKAVESVLYRARRSFREHFQRLFGTEGREQGARSRE
jgi:RNA polymerase sigma-70 factor (ECF subfamily)